MKVKQDKASLRSKTARGSSPATTPTVTEWTASQLVSDVLKGLSEDGSRYVARASGRLDVMGGSAEYSGSLVLNMTVADHVCVAVQRRDDGHISIATVLPNDLGSDRPTVFEQAQLWDGKGHCLSPGERRSLWGGAGGDTTGRVAGALVGLLAAKLIPNLGGGLSVVVGSTMEELGDLGQEAALGAAVLAATTRAMDVQLDPLEAGKALHAVEPGWFSAPVAMADIVGVLVGEPHTLIQVQCEPCKLVGSLRLPDDLTLMGIDCGTTHAQAKKKYEHVRTSAFMGRILIDRILRHEGFHHLQWDGRLSRVSVTDYVQRFRNRIPTKIKGREFLDRFGETGDSLTRIDPDVVYKVRSRTEHHIYEHDRAHQFVECLSRAIRNRDKHALCDAGELMYASHWSYGQRCGLGSIETDLLVNLLRRHGAEADVYGAKVTGRGCGGVVAVFMRTSERATAAVDQAIQDYQAHTGRKAKLIHACSPGVLVAGGREDQLT